MFRRVFLISSVIAFSSTLSASAADVNFAEQVQPIFMEHCAGCHGEKKGLGGLRLHSPTAIQEKAAKDDHLIVKGDPEKSELYERLVLPADHKKFMPKKGKPLPEEKLALIRDWIKQGAAYQVAAESASPPTEDTPSEESHGDDHAEHATEQPKSLPLPEVEAADSAAIEKLTAAGAQVTPVHAGSPLLHVSFALRGEPATDADLALLADVAEQVYSLNLAKAQISSKGLAVLSKLQNVSKLHLEKSSVADDGLMHLSGLSRLHYLNLYGTGITDAGVKHVGGLKHLRQLYVWQTKVSFDAAKGMEKAATGLTVDLGFDHPVVAKQRVTKQLEQAKTVSKELDKELEKTKAVFEKTKKDQEAAKKRLEKLQKELDELNGKVAPEKKEDKNPKDKNAADNVT